MRHKADKPTRDKKIHYITVGLSPEEFQRVQTVLARSRVGTLASIARMLLLQGIKSEDNV